VGGYRAFLSGAAYACLMTSNPTSAVPLALRPEIHGHRGCRGLLPENTLPAFLHALELGVDVLEMDVVIAADGAVVVSHEPWLSALCRDARGRAVLAGTEHAHNLYGMPYAEIRRCDCGLTPHPLFPHQQPVATYKPLLSEVIRSVELRATELGRPAVGYSIEIKATAAGDDIFHPRPAAFVELVLAQLQPAPFRARTTILSFDKRVLREVRRQAPGLPVCLLVEDEEPYASHVAELGFTPDVYGPHYRLVTPALVDSLRTQGVGVVPWTVNHPEAMRALLQLGVAGLTTDYPDVLHRIMHG
jgi:glycerophosphoryl diester phosphodiesterase